MEPITYRVNRKNCRCAVSEVDEYVAVLNGIAVCCQRYHDYREGNRNEIAVDLTVASDMLELNPEDVLEDFQKLGLIRDEDDDESPERRVQTVMSYCGRFCWDYMINPDTYTSADEYHTGERLIRFVVED